MQFSIKIEGVDSVKKEMRKINAKTRAILLDEVTDTATRMAADIKEDAPIGATTDLENSIKWNVTDLTGEVWTNLKYASDVEKGTKRKANRGWANWDDLSEWVRFKFGFGKSKSKKVKNAVSSLTFVIRKKLHDVGTDPQPFFEPNVKRWEKKFYNNVLRRLKRI